METTHCLEPRVLDCDVFARHSSRKFSFPTVLFLFFWAFSTLCARGQEASYDRKTLVRELRANAKSGNASKSDQLLTKTFSQHRQSGNDPELRNYQLNAIHELVQQENKKIYLKTNPDTAAYFNQVLRLHQTAMVLDTLDRQPDGQGHVKPRFTKNVHRKLQPLYPQLLTAGRYFYLHQKFPQAFQHLHAYLEVLRSPVIDERTRQAAWPTRDEAVRLAVLSAYAANQPADVLSTMRGQEETNDTLFLQIEATAYLQMVDTANYLRTLQRANRLYPSDPRFSYPLIHHYIGHNAPAEARLVIRHSLQADSLNYKLYQLLGIAQQALQQPDSSILAYRHAIRLRPDDATLYASLGSVYLDMAHAQMLQPATLQNVKERNSIYAEALQAYLQARKFAPDETDLWMLPLREIYYKLNMGKELREIEKIKNQKK